MSATSNTRKNGIPPLSVAARIALAFIAGVFVGHSGITPEAAFAFLLTYWELFATVGTLTAFASRETAEKVQTILEQPAIQKAMALVRAGKARS